MARAWQQIAYSATPFWTEQGALCWPVSARAEQATPDCFGLVRAQHLAVSMPYTVRAHSAGHRAESAGALQARRGMGTGAAVLPARACDVHSRKWFRAEGSQELRQAGGRGSV